MRVELLTRDHLAEARALLGAALPHDRCEVIAEEKLFGLSLPGLSPRSAQGSLAEALAARAAAEVPLDGSAPVARVLSDQAARRWPIAAGAFDGGALAGVIATAGKFVTVLAVREEFRRRGIATELLAATKTGGGDRVRVCDLPGNYVSPGVDVRYEEARAFLSARKLRPLPEVENIRAPLDGNPLVTPERSGELDAKCASLGYTVSRVSDADHEQVLAFVARTFAPVWAWEAALASHGERHALHAAWHDGEPVAFAAADGNNRGLGWFGPAGTDPRHRGKGLGEALLVRCLDDVRGLPEAGVIAWIGPKAFYARACGAVDDRRFRPWEGYR